MTVAPINYGPAPTGYSAFDFSPLARLGQLQQPDNRLASLVQQYGADPNNPVSTIWSVSDSYGFDRAIRQCDLQD